jgi:class 3 adenylate cyclase/DNA-binding MarR family transcriptional regulator
MNKPASIVQRRLAAIFCADVAGYARLMDADEVGTLRLLTSHRSMTDRLISQHGGRIANTAGDSILAEFPSAVNALQCALGIQERIAAVNDEIPEEQRVSFRIGVHVGEAMIRDGDMFGDGVNVAARMQGLAAPGSVCLSGAAHEYVHKVLPLSFEELGPQSVKNIDHPIPAYLARPLVREPSQTMPPVHRRVEFYLARRFQEICVEALTEISGPEALTPIDLPALASLNDAPEIDQRRLAERLGIDLPRARRIVKRLEGRGLVRHADRTGAGRAHGLSLTPAGIDLLLKLRPAIFAALDRVLAPLSERERATLRDLLARIINANEVGHRI